MHWADKHGITGVIYAGILLNSQVTLAPPNGPVLKDFKLGMLAATSVDFGIDYTNAAVTPDGMLGLALRAMSKGDINGAPASQTIEPIAEAMASQGLVSKRNAGVTLQINRRKTLTTQRDTGVLSFGAADTSLINGEFKYAPTELVFGNLSYWATRINIPALGLSDSSVSDNLAVIDTELYLTSLPATVYNNYIASIPGANLQAGFIVIPNESIKHMKPLELRLSTGASLSLPVSAQLLPDAVNVAQSGDPSKYALAIFDGSVDQTGGFLLGTSLLEYFTLHLDSAHSRIGFGVNANYKP
ncbi:uncharacterized protein L969DRAFT_84176 [Mixia osmundae IAM 14324]|nr:uncharacterized protein L969DRAFT_84176 [Mixia osmundae IAM 14324]KEI42320.1 hypothetical protein L969DRAFT_84176 [Mixia osmundae IAM 14324]